MFRISFFLLISCSFSYAQWKLVTLPVQGSFRSLDVDSKGCIWVGGNQNRVLKSCDRGTNWEVFKLGESFSLDFRGIVAINSDTVVAMSAGLAEEGGAKIYSTVDGGQTWVLRYNSNQEGVFLDGMAFFNSKEGICYGDPIDGRMFYLKTNDGGVSWSRAKGKTVPKWQEGEASYAASNTNIIVKNESVYVATQSNVYYSYDKGEKWSVAHTPMKAGKAAGIFGMGALDGENIFLVGGDYIDDKASYDNFIYSTNSMTQWNSQEVAPSGLKEAILPLNNKKYLLIGTSGTTLWDHELKLSAAVDKMSFHTGKCNLKYCYAIGASGSLGIWRKN